MTRWACIGCWSEGRGDAPGECPECHGEAFFESDRFDADGRRMRECWTSMPPAAEPTVRLHKPSWRWLCVGCWTEGDGWHPAECPTCHETEAWFHTTSNSDRSVRAIFDDLFDRILGAPKGKTKH